MALGEVGVYGRTQIERDTCLFRQSHVRMRIGPPPTSCPGFSLYSVPIWHAFAKAPLFQKRVVQPLLEAWSITTFCGSQDAHAASGQTYQTQRKWWTSMLVGRSQENRCVSLSSAAPCAHIQALLIYKPVGPQPVPQRRHPRASSQIVAYVRYTPWVLLTCASTRPWSLPFSASLARLCSPSPPMAAKLPPMLRLLPRWRSAITALQRHTLWSTSTHTRPVSLALRLSPTFRYVGLVLHAYVSNTFSGL